LTKRRRFRRRPLPPLAIGLLVVGIIVARWWASTPAAPTSALSEGPHRVVRVVDGDTMILADDYRVRLIGVNAPESVKPDSPVEPFGPEASNFTKQFLSGGQARITLDQERLDRFGRYLAYVWVDDRLLNEELLRAGLARWEPNFHYSESMKRRFRKAQQTAQHDKVGIWSKPAPHQPHGSHR